MDRTTTALTAILAVTLTAGFVVLAALGRDTSGYLLFVSGPLVTGAVGAIIARRVSNVQATADAVQSQTNGQLTARLDSVDAQLLAAHDERQEFWHPSSGRPPPDHPPLRSIR